MAAWLSPSSILQATLVLINMHYVFTGSAMAERMQNYRSNVGFKRLEAANEVNSRRDVDALTAFKTALTSDPLGALTSWHANDSDTCGWVGVTCSQESKQVVALRLSGLQLMGTVSNQLSKLESLQVLDLSNNLLVGSIPESLVNCSALSTLNMSYNQFGGGIPSKIEQLLKLQILDIRSNGLTQVIPMTLGNCSSLTYLDLGQNDLHGDIPPSLGSLANLQFLNLFNNSLSGSLPDSLGNCTSLTYLRVSYNSALGGELPFQWSQLRSLQYFSVGSCNFHGTFPMWVLNFTSLYEFSLGYNRFYGELPEEIGQLVAIQRLVLVDNNFTGVIPISITNCTQLINLNLAQNQLSGDVPSELGSLTNLAGVLLYENSLSGMIPASIANCSSLSGIYLGYNPFNDQVIPSWIVSLVNLVEIFWPAMNLQGPIPGELGRLPALLYLSLYLNNLTGSIPDALGNRSTLSLLNLRSNQLTGQIPSALGNLLQLNFFQLAFNPLTGSFPAFVFNMTQATYISLQSCGLKGRIDHGDWGRLRLLQRIFLGENAFSGPIPTTIGNCSTLISLNLDSNRLSGLVPSSLGNLTNLAICLLDKNDLQGSIPVDITKCASLYSLSLQNNALEGSISPEVGHLSLLQDLLLSGNNLTGTLPGSLGNCTKMIKMDLSHNRFFGNVPGDSIFKMSTTLNYLDLSNNFFSGAWPREFGLLVNIYYINMSRNNISGPVPVGLGKCTSLESLDLSFNELTGAIPQDLAELRHLKFFNVSYNDFQGAIPESGVFSSNLTETSFLGNPKLCGSILPAHCPVIHARSCKAFKCNRVWIPVACTGVIVGVILISLTGTWLFKNYKTKTEGVVMRFHRTHNTITKKDVLAAIEGGSENMIGTGAKGIVYKGISQQGEVFAVKVLAQDDKEEENGEADLLQEVNMLGQLRHRNILKVYGYFSHVNEQAALVLEYMPEGSLYHQLYKDEICKLTWEQRLNVAVGVAHALFYLHHDFEPAIIHGDLKPRNILLDADLEPKVCDFGISKFASRQREGDATASKFCGTIGYMPPEYASDTRVSTKGDIYSFGVILLELLTRRQAASGNTNGHFGQNESLLDWVKEHFKEKPFELLDLALQGECTTSSNIKEQMMLLMRVGLLCVREAPQDRPSMQDVLGMLTQIKEIGLDPLNQRMVVDLLVQDTICIPSYPSDITLSC